MNVLISLLNDVMMCMRSQDKHIDNIADTFTTWQHCVDSMAIALICAMLKYSHVCTWCKLFLDGILCQDVMMLNFFPQLNESEFSNKHEFIFVIDRSGLYAPVFYRMIF